MVVINEKKKTEQQRQSKVEDEGDKKVCGCCCTYNLNRGGALLKFLFWDMFGLLVGIATVVILFFIRQNTKDKPDERNWHSDLAVEIWAGRVVYLNYWVVSFFRILCD